MNLSSLIRMIEDQGNAICLDRLDDFITDAASMLAGLDPESAGYEDVSELHDCLVEAYDVLEATIAPLGDAYDQAQYILKNGVQG